jgi:prepilin-type N-terminal cleavage/methylation domain-containing protein
MRSRSKLRSAGTDDGFTLVELLIAIVIIAVITVPLSGVVIGYLRNTDATTARLLASHDVQIVSAYWAQDVASIGTRGPAPTYTLAQSVETNVAYNSGLYPCGAAGTPAAVARLAWDDFSGAGPATVVRVAYVVENTTELHRLRCNGSATVVSDVMLAHDLATAPTCSGPSGVSCTSAPAVPTQMTLNLTLTDPGNPGATYVVPLTGKRRQS